MWTNMFLVPKKLHGHVHRQASGSFVPLPKRCRLVCQRPTARSAFSFFRGRGLEKGTGNGERSWLTLFGPMATWRILDINCSSFEKGLWILCFPIDICLNCCNFDSELCACRFHTFRGTWLFGLFQATMFQAPWDIGTTNSSEWLRRSVRSGSCSAVVVQRCNDMRPNLFALLLEFFFNSFLYDFSQFFASGSMNSYLQKECVPRLEEFKTQDRLLVFIAFFLRFTPWFSFSYLLPDCSPISSFLLDILKKLTSKNGRPKQFGPIRTMLLGALKHLLGLRKQRLLSWGHLPCWPRCSTTIADLCFKRMIFRAN